MEAVCRCFLVVSLGFLGCCNAIPISSIRSGTPSRSPPLAQAFCDHGGYKSIQANPFLTRLGHQTCVEAPGHALPPLATGGTRIWNQVTVLNTVQKVSLDCVRALPQRFLRSFPIGDTPRQVWILNRESSAIRFGERTNGSAFSSELLVLDGATNAACI